jgi:hypothetical protein
MSSPATSQIAHAKTERPKSLPDKYGKFIQFAYYMLDNTLSDIIQLDKHAYLEKIKLFATVEEQQALVQGFLDNAKENKKKIKTALAERKKALALANKPVKTPRTKKTSTEEPGNSRKRTTKKDVQTAENQLLNELVELAQPLKVAEPIVVEQEPVAAEPEVKPKRKQTKKEPVAADVPAENQVVTTEPEVKPKRKQTKKEAAAAVPAENQVVTDELIPETFVTEPEAKPKRKQTKKTKQENTNATTNAAILDDLTTIPNTDIEISPVTFSGTTYFMDENSNLYAYPTPTARSIGKYNPFKQEVTLN